MRNMKWIAMVLGLIILCPQHGDAEVDPLWTHTYRYTTSDASLCWGGPSVDQTLDGFGVLGTRAKGCNNFRPAVFEELNICIDGHDYTPLF